MKKVTLYSTQWCGACRSGKRLLNEKNIPYHEIDIDQNEGATRQVIEWSGGRRVIPTYVIEKLGEASPAILHNPPAALLLKELCLS